MRLRLPLGLLVAATLIAGASGACSGDDDEALACPEPTLTDGPHTLEVDGAERTYHLNIPPRLTAPTPVVLSLHGLGGSAASQESLTGMATAGVARGFIVVTPESNRPDRGWALPGIDGGDADVRFLDELLDAVEDGLCVDPDREYATGASNGAGLAVATACALPGRLAGIAPVAGVSLQLPCADASPLTLVAFHGTDDTVIPYAGGTPVLVGPVADSSELAEGLDETQLAPVDQVVAAWADGFGCAPAVLAKPAMDVAHATYAPCDERVRVELYTVTGGGHTWPGGLPVPSLGVTTSSISATQLILDAFSRPTSR
jgi:polyhydroxybutyrate depolymerase